MSYFHGLVELVIFSLFSSQFLDWIINSLIQDNKNKTFNYWASLVVQMVKNPPAMQKTWVQSPDWEDALEEGMATHSSTVVQRIHGQRSLVGYSPWGPKKLEMTEQFSLTHSSLFLDWIINSPIQDNKDRTFNYRKPPCAKKYSKHFTCFSAFNLYNNLEADTLLLSLLQLGI